ncbi:hypothetical protein [Embleya sp. NPDC005575]|uniref:hypothetical protein n=1 Tax=Embleya sp. NPDC005575 TaxID=3156892 RepID=UPI0033B12CD9
MEAELQYRVVLAVDVERSAGRGNVALDRVREVLAATLRESVAESGIDWQACLCDDLGDGFRVTLPAGVRKTRLIHPLVHELAVRLRAHNRTAGPSTRIRIRIALHAGDVRLDPAGPVTGQPLEVLARLLDAAVARAALAEAPETVPAVLVVSGHFHDETVRHGYPGIDPDAFRQVTVAEKEYSADAWLHLPGYAAPPPESVPADAAREPAAGRSKMVNNASGHGVINAMQHGTQNINLPLPGNR